jgi:tungstate transport system ATP-binding protein
VNLYQLRDIHHHYGERVVLDLPTLDIERGEVLALVGPSGSGKSTLLRLLQFIEAPSHGSLTFDGQAIAGLADLEVRRRIATVFQSPALLDRSVYDNVAFGLRLRGQRDAHDRVSSALNQVGLIDLARANARTLSGG